MKKIIDNIRKIARKYVSPTFLVLLSFSFLLWVLIQMGHTYTADVVVPVNIEGARIKVRCEARGTGYRIFAHRFLRRSDIKVRLLRLDVSPSPTDPDKLVINPSSLLVVISAHTKDLKILSIGEVPEIPAPNKD